MTSRTYGSSTQPYWKRVSGSNGYGKVNRYVGEIMWCGVNFAQAGRVGTFRMSDGYMVAVTNKALNNFNQKLQQAQFLASLAEARKTASTIQVRAIKALQLASALSRRDVKAIKKYFLSFKTPPQRVRGKRRYSNRSMHYDKSRIPAAWLEFNFVYRPLAGDVKAFHNIMNEPFPYDRIKGRASETHNESTSIAGKSYQNVVTSRCSIYGYARVKNPSAGLATQLGFSDVIGTVWELIPWSWAIDYFANVGDYLSNISPIYDKFEWTMKGSTKMVQNLLYKQYREKPSVPYRVETFNGIRIERSPQIPSFAFQFSFELNLQRTSYLMSAIALTLKGKFK